MSMDTNWHPTWTTEVKIEGGGRFPLGLNRFHNGLEEILIKSITWLANRLRYFTYSCWAIGDIENNSPCENWSDFVEAFQRRESALAIGLYLLEPEYSVPGSNKVSKLVGDGVDQYDCSFSIMESNRLGAFGLYYIGTAYNLGLIEYNEMGVVVLTPEGWKLHTVADRRLRNARLDYYRIYRGKRIVPANALLHWGEANDFDNIREPFCQDERDYFKSLLFRLNQSVVDDYRRYSFALFLECIERCVDNRSVFTEDNLSNINYYSSYFSDSGDLVEFSTPEHFRDVQFYWTIYEGHHYFRWWLSLLFQTFLDHLKANSDGSTLEGFFAALDREEINETVSQYSGIHAEWMDLPFRDLMNSLGGYPQLQDTFSEESITASRQHMGSTSIVAEFVIIMADLYLRFKNLRRDKRYQYVALNLSSDLWFDVLFRMPNLQNMTIRAFLEKMLKSYVLDQHDRIMIEKNDLRRCWFTTEQGRYFFEADVGMIGRPAKYGTIMNYLRDMNLIQGNEEELIKLTSEGTELFQKLKRDYY